MASFSSTFPLLLFSFRKRKRVFIQRVQNAQAFVARPCIWVESALNPILVSFSTPVIKQKRFPCATVLVPGPLAAEAGPPPLPGPAVQGGAAVACRGGPEGGAGPARPRRGRRRAVHRGAAHAAAGPGAAVAGAGGDSVPGEPGPARKAAVSPSTVCFPAALP